MEDATTGARWSWTCGLPQVELELQHQAEEVVKPAQVLDQSVGLDHARLFRWLLRMHFYCSWPRQTAPPRIASNEWSGTWRPVRRSPRPSGKKTSSRLQLFKPKQQAEMRSGKESKKAWQNLVHLWTAKLTDAAGSHRWRLQRTAFQSDCQAHGETPWKMSQTHGLSRPNKFLHRGPDGPETKKVRICRARGERRDAPEEGELTTNDLSGEFIDASEDRRLGREETEFMN